MVPRVPRSSAECVSTYVHTCVPAHVSAHMSETAEQRGKNGVEGGTLGKRMGKTGRWRKEGGKEHAYTAPIYSHAWTQEDQHSNPSSESHPHPLSRELQSRGTVDNGGKNVGK